MEILINSEKILVAVREGEEIKILFDGHNSYKRFNISSEEKAESLFRPIRIRVGANFAKN